MKAMKLAVFLSLVASATAQADNYVNGYTRRDGTYVQPHYRSEPNSIRYDNYSSQGNTNPYTAQAGHQRNEFSTPPAYNQSYGGGNSFGGNSFDGYNQ